MAVDEKVNGEVIGEENATADLLPCCPTSTKKPCYIGTSDRTLPAAVIGCRNFCEQEFPPRNVKCLHIALPRSHYYPSQIYFLDLEEIFFENFNISENNIINVELARVSG
jgi:hypothetical protein